MLSESVEIAVILIHADPTADDLAIHRDLRNCGVDEATSVRLVQFVPIVFTRFLYRESEVQFAADYVVRGPDGQPFARRPVVSEPVYQEGWGHCERAAANGAEEDYFATIAARSGGYRALQELIGQGLDLAGIITSPPIMFV